MYLGRIRKGPRNHIGDIGGILVGNVGDEAVRTGVTVVLPEARAVAGGDVRGGGPGTRETDLLDPSCLVDAVDAVVLSGGSSWGLDAASGQGVVLMDADLQDPPELIPEFVKHWEEGYKLVMAIKPVSKGVAWVHALRKAYYRFVDGISDISLVADSTGFGLYDRKVLDHLRQINDPYPFLRGLICELGYDIKTIPFDQPRRLRGISKNNFYTLYDIAMLGIVSHSKVPIRIAAFVGFALGLFSVLAAMVFLILKLLFWESFPLGIAPVVIGLFFLFGIQLMFIGILGEYIGSIHTYLQRRPVVVEKERINF